MSENVISILTAAGASALAAVRFSGPGVGTFFERRLSKPLAAGRCVHGELRDDDGVVDDPVCALNADGSVDVTLHGSPYILDLVLSLARRHGFAERDPVATTIEAEVRAALPLVRSERAARMLLAQVDAWATGSPDASDRALYHLLHPPTVAIVGVPNAGKSTLANALFGTRRSIVSDVPGTTRDWVGELADLDGLIVTLVDTPGLRASDDPIEREAIERSRAPIASADVVILLLDATGDVAAQRATFAHLSELIVAANKVDVTAAPDDAIPLVARDGVGVDRLIEAIHARFGLNDRPHDAPRAWTSHQLASLRKLA